MVTKNILNLIRFPQPNFRKPCIPKFYFIFRNTKSQQSSVIDNMQQNIINFIKVYLEYTNNSHKKNFKTTIALQFQEPLPQNNARLGQQIESTKKYCMFS